MKQLIGLIPFTKIWEMTMNSELILEQIDKIVAQIDEINAALKRVLESDDVEY